MRKLICIGVFAAAASLAPASPAQAGALGFTGTLGVVIANLPPITITGSGMALVSGVGIALEGLGLPAGAFATLASIPVDDQLAFPIAGVVADASNGAGSFGGGGSLGGAMPLLGSATLCLFTACDASPAANLVVPFTQGGTRGIGLGGPPITVTGLVSFTVSVAPWTVGQASAAGAFVQGFVHGPNGGGAETAAQPGGSVQLVTPVVIRTSIPGGEVFPAFGILTLHFVPEPGTLALLAAGVAGLGLAGRSRLRG